MIILKLTAFIPAGHNSFKLLSSLLRLTSPQLYCGIATFAENAEIRLSIHIIYTDNRSGDGWTHAARLRAAQSSLSTAGTRPSGEQSPEGVARQTLCRGFAPSSWLGGQVTICCSAQEPDWGLLTFTSSVLHLQTRNILTHEYSR